MATRARPGPVDSAPSLRRVLGLTEVTAGSVGIIIGADVIAHAEPLAIGLGAALCATGLAAGWLPRRRA
jgi:hypothetical protein